MYEVGVVAQFEAAHHLVGNFGPATRVHGHTYRLEVIVRGDELASDGTLYDIGTLRPRVDDMVARLHYQDLNTLPGLSDHNTTAEMVASYCWDQLAPTLRGAPRLRTLRVAVWESPLVYAARDEGL